MPFAFLMGPAQFCHRKRSVKTTTAIIVKSWCIRGHIKHFDCPLQIPQEKRGPENPGGLAKDYTLHGSGGGRRYQVFRFLDQGSCHHALMRSVPPSEGKREVLGTASSEERQQCALP